VNALDRHVVGNASSTAGHLSDLTVTLAIVAPAVGDAFALGWNRPLFEDAVVYAQTLFVNGALTTGAKLAFQRPRPITYTGDPVWVGKSEGYVSFYSGHTSTAFAALGAASMTIGYRYGSWALPWAVTALVGVSVAAERVAAGRHFYTDVGAGALAGIAVGVAVPWLHRRTGATVTPGPADSFGLGVSRRF
jgi:membrane-associated phospholipid phosphatase